MTQRKYRSHLNNSGTVLVESAITLLLLFTVLFGIMETGRFVSFQQTLTDAAREGTRIAVAPVTRTSTMASDGEIETQVNLFLDSNHISGADINIERPIVIDTNGVPTEFTRVTVQAPYEILTLSMFSDLSVTLSGRSLMRNETSP
jgi:Flp pilus assembly protein TadG